MAESPRASQSFPPALVGQLPIALVLTEGLVALLVGIWFFTQPLVSLLTSLLMLGTFWLVRGVIVLVGLLWNREELGWKILIGFLSVLAGVVVLARPLGAGLDVPMALVYFVALQGIVAGSMEVWLGLRAQRSGPVAMGLLSAAFGLLLLTHPLFGVQALHWVFGLVAVGSGLVTLWSMAVRVTEERLVPHTLPEPDAPSAATPAIPATPATPG